MKYPKLNKTIHEQTKLRILIYLSKNYISTFVQIKNDLALSSGNLSIQLKNLEEKDLIIQKRRINNKKTITEVSITNTGKTALLEYLNEMENLLSQIKRGK